MNQEANKQTRVLVIADGRSGATWFISLLNNHEHFQLNGELLNTEDGLKFEPPSKQSDERNEDSLWAQLNQHFSRKPVAGFRITPEQLQFHKLSLNSLLVNLKIDHTIVFWRENILNSFISLKAAEKTGIWYNELESEIVELGQRQIRLDVTEFNEYRTGICEDWKCAGNSLPLHCRVQFVQYETFQKDTLNIIRQLWKQLCPAYPWTDTLDIDSSMIRQNPEPIESRILNWPQVKDSVAETSKVDLSECFYAGCLERFPLELRSSIPQWGPIVAPYCGSKIRVSEPFISEQAKLNVFDAIHGSSISSASIWPDKMSAKLKEVFNVTVAQPCANGFASLLLALQCCAFESDTDDSLEVIVPSFTMVAVPNAAHFMRLKPVFVDNSPGAYNPGANEIAEAGTQITRAVVVTHTYGVPCEIEEIVKLCKDNGWVLIEDISEAIGIKLVTTTACGSQEEKFLGTFGDFGCASLYANKMITAGDGGFVIANNINYEGKLKQLANHGFTGGYHFLHFEKATNSKINGLGAALLCGNLDHLNEVIEERSKIASLYRKGLSKCPLKLMPQCGPKDSPWMFGVECDSCEKKNNLRKWLADHGIETRNYFLPLSIQPAYWDSKLSRPDSNAHCQTIADVGLYLPTYHGLSGDQVFFICNVVQRFFDSNVSIATPPLVIKAQALTYDQSNLNFEIRTYENNGDIINIDRKVDSPVQIAVRLLLNIREIYNEENFSEKEKYTGILKFVLSDLKDVKTPLARRLQDKLEQHLDYLNKAISEEFPTVRPWLGMAMSSELKDIPTTTEPETLQLLKWLTQHCNVRNIVEVGSWFGASAMAMAEGLVERYGNETSSICKVFSIDSFVWQNWMYDYYPNEELKTGDSIQNIFTKNFAERYGQFVMPILKKYETSFDSAVQSQIPPNFQADLVFLDFSETYSDNDEAWRALEKYFVPNHTILVINGIGLGQGLMKFVTERYNALEGLYKPFSLAKAFIYKNSLANVETKSGALCPIQLKFAEMPGWDHHLNRAFERSIDWLKSKYEDKSSEEGAILFVPAVEQYLCDFESIDGPWIGIVHEVMDNPQYLYVPDLKRLMLSHKFAATLRNCVGLFTLTSTQQKFILDNMPTNFEFPVTRLNYPCEIGNVKDEKHIGTIPSIPSNENAVLKQTLVLIGSYLRDYDFFFRIIVPPNYRKIVLAGQPEDQSRLRSLTVPQDVEICARLEANDYEKMLDNCFPFLCFKSEGAASTLLLECISRNVPIVAPRLACCTDYIGEDYPLLFSPDTENFTTLLTNERIEKARNYLCNMDKSVFSKAYFLKSFEQSAVLLNAANVISTKTYGSVAENCLAGNFDCTILVISYKRIYNMEEIMKHLLSQSYEGTMEIIVWNNNMNRNAMLRSVIEPFIRQSTKRRTFRLIDSSTNYYCSPRIAMVHIMKSPVLLICDDDVIPKHQFVQTMMTNHAKHPNDVLCFRGHTFLPHNLSMENPKNVWTDYDHLRFIPDHDKEQLIHFVHADVCAIPLNALRKLGEVVMPDPSWVLVDDYWMSFVLNYYFGVPLRKIHAPDIPFIRSECSEDEKIALYKQTEVTDTRLRFYVYHMIKGWPVFSDVDKLGTTGCEKIASPVDTQLNYAIRKKNNEMDRKSKQNFWKQGHCGFNISSELTENDIQDLQQLQVKLVRIGAVGTSASESSFDLDGFIPTEKGIISFDSVARLVNLVQKLKNTGICVVITLNVRIFSPYLWRVLAQALSKHSNIVGYDLVNEPYTEIDDPNKQTGIISRWKDWDSLLADYIAAIQEIRCYDKATPIVVESTYWANYQSLMSISWNDIKRLKDENIIFSFHFYHPHRYVCRQKNQQQFKFPGVVPEFNNKHSPTCYWDRETVDTLINEVAQWTRNMKLESWQIFVGEMGCSRDAPGAEEYMDAVLDACRTNGFSTAVYAFREPDWDAHNYELGPEVANSETLASSNLMKIISKHLLMFQEGAKIIHFNDKICCAQ